jgi:hypothetical protein
MVRLYVLLLILFFTTGCSSRQNVSIISSPEIQNTSSTESAKVKIVNWCNRGEGNDMWVDKVKAENGKVWVVSEFFNGMEHAPTVRHVCRENKEVFYLKMDWAEASKRTRVCKLISLSSLSTFNINSSQTDPEFKLLESKKSNQIVVLVDGKIVVYDEANNIFSK